MTVIGGKHIDTSASQQTIVFSIAGTEAARITGTRVFQDANAIPFRGLAGATTSITSGSAATAGGTSGLSSFTIAHGLAATPTIYGVEPSGVQSALASLLGAYVTADATNVYYNTVASVTATKQYDFSWYAAP